MGNYKLPEDFFFGAAMSGPQTEGAWQAYGKIPNLWDYWSNQNITDFYNLVVSYGGNDFTRRRDEDLAIFKDLGLTSVRTSIQWSRLMNAYGKLNPEGAKCRGYHWWAVIDCWSWANAFKDRYGFVEVNLSDNYSRHLKKSADYLRRVATTHEIFES